MKFLVVGLAALMVIGSSIAQSVYIVSAAKNQVLVYRYSSSGPDELLLIEAWDGS